MNWVGQRFRAPGDNRSRIDDYTTVDLTLRRRKLFEYFDLAASVQNVFNEDAREPGSAALLNDYPLAGRFYYFEASIRF